MIPINFSPILSSVTGATTPVAGGAASPANGAQFSSKLGALSSELGAPGIPLTGGVNATSAPGAALPTATVGGINEPTTFGHLAQQMIRDVNEKQQVAGHLVRDVLAGGSTPVHQALIATEEASVSFQMLTEVRNKVVEAYQEVMRMSV